MSTGLIRMYNQSRCRLKKTVVYVHKSRKVLSTAKHSFRRARNVSVVLPMSLRSLTARCGFKEIKQISSGVIRSNLSISLAKREIFSVPLKAILTMHLSAENVISVKFRILKCVLRNIRRRLLFVVSNFIMLTMRIKIYFSQERFFLAESKKRTNGIRNLSKRKNFLRHRFPQVNHNSSF